MLQLRQRLGGRGGLDSVGHVNEEAKGSCVALTAGEDSFEVVVDNRAAY